MLPSLQQICSPSPEMLKFQLCVKTTLVQIAYKSSDFPDYLDFKCRTVYNNKDNNNNRTDMEMNVL